MSRERRQRSVSSPRDRVDVRAKPRKSEKPAPGIPARILSALGGLFSGGTRQITVAGTTQGFSGDGMAATSAQLFDPRGITIDADGIHLVKNRAEKVANT